MQHQGLPRPEVQRCCNPFVLRSKLLLPCPHHSPTPQPTRPSRQPWPPYPEVLHRLPQVVWAGLGKPGRLPQRVPIGANELGGPLGLLQAVC